MSLWALSCKSLESRDIVTPVVRILGRTGSTGKRPALASPPKRPAQGTENSLTLSQAAAATASAAIPQHHRAILPRAMPLSIRNARKSPLRLPPMFPATHPRRIEHVLKFPRGQLRNIPLSLRHLAQILRRGPRTHQQGTAPTATRKP